MPKITLSSDELPPNIDLGETFYIRVRAVSLDENRTSHWVYHEVPQLNSGQTSDFIEIDYTATTGVSSIIDPNYLNTNTTWRIDTFTDPSTTINVTNTDPLIQARALIIGGGGGGGSQPSSNGSSGGGGAGGFVELNSLVLQEGENIITVGTGGGATQKGGDSTAFGYIARGGGQGNGGSGGSGGGAKFNGGKGSATQSSLGYGFGSNGGGGYNASPWSGGGGGGASGGGSGGSGSSGGKGGSSKASTVSGSEVDYCGGGGGGCENAGPGGGGGAGAGNGGRNGNGQAAQIPNVGSGGGGAGGIAAASGGRGSNGVVILAYRIA